MFSNDNNVNFPGYINNKIEKQLQKLRTFCIETNSYSFKEGDLYEPIVSVFQSVEMGLKIMDTHRTSEESLKCEVKKKLSLNTKNFCQTIFYGVNYLKTNPSK
jgi:hypothetical protein